MDSLVEIDSERSVAAKSRGRLKSADPDKGEATLGKASFPQVDDLLQRRIQIKRDAENDKDEGQGSSGGHLSGDLLRRVTAITKAHGD